MEGIFLCIPELDSDLVVDVLIIGGGITSALTAYIFKEKEINTAIINSEPVFNNNAEIYDDIDTGLNKTLTNLNSYQKIDLFSLFLESLYKFTDIINHLDDNCDFVRKPNIYCDGNLDNLSKFTLPFSSNLLSYNSGTSVNLGKLEKQLYRYLSKNKVPVFENTTVYEINMSNCETQVVTTDKKQIKCKKLIMVNPSTSRLFFDKPDKLIIKSLHKVSGSLYQMQDRYLYTNGMSELKYYFIPVLNNKGVTYHFNDLSLNHDDTYPYIAVDEEYPNVYYNIEMDKEPFLFSLMGAMLLSEKYLGNDDKRLELLKNLR